MWERKNFIKKSASINFTPRTVYVALYDTALSDFEWRCNEEGAAALLCYALPTKKKRARIEWIERVDDSRESIRINRDRSDRTRVE